MAATLANMRARLLRYYKRKDVPAATINEWIVDAVRRIQQMLRAPIDETSARAVIPPDFTGGIAVPSNLLNLISIQVDGVELQMRATTEVNLLQRSVGWPCRYYARQGGVYLLAPMPETGSTVTIFYRGDFDSITQDTDTCPLFDVAPDLVVAGALIFANMYAIDDAQMAKYNSAFTARFQELQDMADRDDLLNGSIGLAYNPNGRF